MDRKTTIIAGVVVVVLVIGGALVFTKKDDKTPASSKTSTSNTSDTNSTDTNEEDLGLCSLVTVATIKTNLGPTADGLTGPNNTGVTSLGDGDKGQTCVYPFGAGGTVANSFYTDLAMYSKESFAKIVDFTATGGTAVSGVGDKASFESNEPLGVNSKEFSLTAIKGTNVYKFVISQPADAVTFGDTEAQDALTTIAKSATLK